MYKCLYCGSLEIMAYYPALIRRGQTMYGKNSYMEQDGWVEEERIPVRVECVDCGEISDNEIAWGVE